MRIINVKPIKDQSTEIVDFCDMGYSQRVFGRVNNTDQLDASSMSILDMPEHSSISYSMNSLSSAVKVSMYLRSVKDFPYSVKDFPFSQMYTWKSKDMAKRLPSSIYGIMKSKTTV